MQRAGDDTDRRRSVGVPRLRGHGIPTASGGGEPGSWVRWDGEGRLSR